MSSRKSTPHKNNTATVYQFVSHSTSDVQEIGWVHIVLISCPISRITHSSLLQVSRKETDVSRRIRGEDNQPVKLAYRFVGHAAVFFREKTVRKPAVPAELDC